MVWIGVRFVPGCFVLKAWRRNFHLRSRTPIVVVTLMSIMSIVKQRRHVSIMIQRALSLLDGEAVEDTREKFAAQGRGRPRRWMLAMSPESKSPGLQRMRFEAVWTRRELWRDTEMT